MWNERNILFLAQQLTRIPGFRSCWRKFPVGSVDLRTNLDIWDRPQYAFGVYSAAKLAAGLRLNGISIIEFGVAGGNGLVALERIAEAMAQRFDLHIDVYGFDTGEGMPAPCDYRDVPCVWGQGFYRTDVDSLKSRLNRAHLLLGDVSETIPKFLTNSAIQPIGFVAFDLDYYSSTKKAFRVFAGPSTTVLPRVFCYFDDIVEPQQAYLNEYLGELCAIREYNLENEKRKITKIQGLPFLRQHPDMWNEQMYVHHDFGHLLYERLVTPEGSRFRQLPLQ
jgi:hypothetical protein